MYLEAGDNGNRSGGTGEVLLNLAHEGYDVEGTSLVQVNTSTFLSEQTVALPSNGGLIALSPNDHKLVATSSGGAIIVGI